MFPPEEFWIVVSEWDCDPKKNNAESDHPAEGPLVMESYTRLSEADARSRAGDHPVYGKTVAIRVRANECLIIRGTCSWPNCTEIATAIVAGRLEHHREPAAYCKSHAATVLDEGSPEYTPICPRCSCAFGVN